MRQIYHLHFKFIWIEEIVVTAQALDFKGLGVGPGSTFDAEDISTLPQ